MSDSTGLTSTIAELSRGKLTAYYAPPPPGVPLVQPSTDPAVFVGDTGYLKQLNQQAFQKYAVDVPNQNAHDRYDFRCQQWEQNGKPALLPTPPSYVILYQHAYDQWWSQVNNENRGQNAPPLFFIKPAELPPPPVIVPDGEPPPAPPATDGPIGQPVPGNPGVFNASAVDSFPDGWVYIGPAGVFQKHVYANPFTVTQTRVIWIQLQRAA